MGRLACVMRESLQKYMFCCLAGESPRVIVQARAGCEGNLMRPLACGTRESLPETQVLVSSWPKALCVCVQARAGCRGEPHEHVP